MKGPSAQPQFNGSLWHAIFKAAQLGCDNGYDCLRLEWMKSHLTSDVAQAHSQCPAKWLANATADLFADRAAELFQLSSQELLDIRLRSEQFVFILKRLVAIAIKLFVLF